MALAMTPAMAGGIGMRGSHSTTTPQLLGEVPIHRHSVSRAERPTMDDADAIVGGR